MLVWFDPDRYEVALTALLLAVVCGWLTGPFAHRAVPLYWIVIEFTLGAFGRRLDKRQRSRPDLVLRGMIYTLLVGLVSYGIGDACRLGLARLFAGPMPEALPLAALLAAGAVWRTMRGVHAALARKRSSGIGKARPFLTLSRSTRIDFSGTDDHAMTRETVAAVARLFTMGVVGPLAWYLAAGLPGAFVYSGLASAAWQFGKNGFAKGFGVLPLAAEALTGCLPSVMSACLIALAAIFTPGARMAAAFAAPLRRRGRAPYVQGGAPVSAMAGALNAALGGPATDLDASAMPRGWAGPSGATAQLAAGHIRRALYISVVAHLLVGLGLGVAVLWLNLR